MNQIISAVLVVGITGLIFGCILALASVIFAVKKDERIDKIAEVLPGANCGACGMAGCSAYASAIVENGAAINLCSVGKSAVAEKIADIMGCEAGDVKELTAKVLCGGNCEKAKDKYIYNGIDDCRAAAKLAGGAKECSYGCLGLGSCVKVCMFDAISIVDGVAYVDEEKCGGCGMCKNVCPKNIIELIPKNAKASVLCSNKDKGAAVNKYCSVGCIGCKLCEKNCPEGAITVSDNCAVIDYDKCSGCGICAEKCPKKVIEVKNVQDCKKEEENSPVIMQ